MLTSLLCLTVPLTVSDHDCHRYPCRCWYFDRCLTSFALVGIIPAFHERPRQEMSCPFGCEWQINVSRRVADGMWHFNKTHLIHTGHPSPTESAAGETSPSDKFILDSRKSLPLDVKDFVKEKLLESTPTGSIRRVLIHKFGQKYGWNAIETETWNDIVKAVRKECGLSNDGQQISHLVDFIQEARAKENPLSLGGSIEWGMKADDDGRCDRLFFMNDIMKENFRRNGQFIVMDTTCQTNCFGMYLIILTVLDQDWKCAIVSTGLVRKESIESFAWFLEQTKNELVRTYGESIWDQVDVICTDGDLAFPPVIEKFAPKAHHARCFFHLQLNITQSKIIPPTDKKKLNAGLQKLRLIQDPNEWNTRWLEFVSSCKSTESVFMRKEDRNVSNPVRHYLESYFSAIKETWVLAFINGRTTFGFMSTSVGESVNNQVKCLLKNGSNLVTVFSTLHSITIDTFHQSINRMSRQREQIRMITQRRPDNSAGPLSFSQRLLMDVTSTAAGLIEKEYVFIENYSVEIRGKDESDKFTVSVKCNNSIQPKERVVTVSLTTMTCTCHHPASFLLPCRHVLAANRAAFEHPFIASQVHDRWRCQTLPDEAVPARKFTSRFKPVDLSDAQYTSFTSFFSHFFPSDSPTVTKSVFEDRLKEYTQKTPETKESIFVQLSKASNHVISGIANTPSQASKFAILTLMFDMMAESFLKGETHLEKKKRERETEDDVKDPPKVLRSGKVRNKRSGSASY